MLLDLRQITSRLTNPLTSRFKKGLDAAFGTHRSSLLKKSGWEDAVLALWICNLYVTLQGRSKVLVQDPKLNTRLTEWIQYMQELYPIQKLDPAYATSICTTNTAPPPSLRQQNEPEPESEPEADAATVGTDPNVDENERTLIRYTKEIALMLRNAAQVAPRCIFDHALWSGDLVRWGFHVLNEEGVCVPVLDDDGDAEGVGMLAICVGKRQNRGTEGRSDGMPS